MRHLLTLFELSPAEIERIFDIAEDLKLNYARGVREPILAGRVMGMLFEKPSLRTRVSFEAAMAHLGGASLFLGEDVGWNHRESIQDFARVLGKYLDVVVCRAGEHRRVEELARYAECPVINGLTNLAHPCQALADLFTIREAHGSLTGRTLAFVGDGNNVARSLAVACAKVGMRLAIASPKGYELDDAFIARLCRDMPSAEVARTSDPRQAVKEAVAVYTDVWASMGQEHEAAQRKKDFADYQVDARLMKHAPPDACFLHCLPAHRGEEVADEVIDSPRSAVIEQAANRMHVQKGILAWILGARH
jgi:ornithine carbamoyltransferase